MKLLSFQTGGQNNLPLLRSAWPTTSRHYNALQGLSFSGRILASDEDDAKFLYDGCKIGQVPDMVMVTVAGRFQGAGEEMEDTEYRKFAFRQWTVASSLSRPSRDATGQISNPD
jgi:hypothetical protein